MRTVVLAVARLALAIRADKTQGPFGFTVAP